jgi:hypothetical protein
MEPEGSLPFFKEPATGPYSEWNESSLHLPTLFHKDLIKYNFPIYTFVFQVASSLQVL